MNADFNLSSHGSEKLLLTLANSLEILSNILLQYFFATFDVAQHTLEANTGIDLALYSSTAGSES